MTEFHTIYVLHRTVFHNHTTLPVLTRLDFRYYMNNDDKEWQMLKDVGLAEKLKREPSIEKQS